MKQDFRNLADAVRTILCPHFGPALVVNDTATFSLDGNRNVQIELITRRTMDKYEGLRVQIIHKQNGVVITQYFPFEDYLCPQDGQTTVPDAKWHIWKNDGVLSWYGKVPTNSSMTEMTDAIDDYIAIWKLKE